MDAGAGETRIGSSRSVTFRGTRKNTRSPSSAHDVSQVASIASASRGKSPSATRSVESSPENPSSDASASSGRGRTHRPSEISPTDRPCFPSRFSNRSVMIGPTLTRLQQGAGNRVISRLIGTKAFEVAKIIQLPEPERIEELKKRVAAKDTLATERIWSSFGAREVEIAKDNRELFVQSMEFAGSGILEHQPWKDLKKKFEGDVLAVATSNLQANRDFVQAEMEKTGAFGVDGKEGEPSAEQRASTRWPTRADRTM